MCCAARIFFVGPPWVWNLAPPLGGTHRGGARCSRRPMSRRRPTLATSYGVREHGSDSAGWRHGCRLIRFVIADDVIERCAVRGGSAWAWCVHSFRFCTSGRLGRHHRERWHACTRSSTHLTLDQYGCSFFFQSSVFITRNEILS
jgi:hypothetical protein